MTTPDYTDHFMIHEQAKVHNMSVNSDVERVHRACKALCTNEIKYGAPYCPCLNNHNEDTICPCKYMREQQACRCGLYVKKKGRCK